MLSSSLPPIYVLSVKTFTDRIKHINHEMSKHNLQFEFIFENDIQNIDSIACEKTFEHQANLSLAAKSLTLKHISAWRKAVEHGHHQILIFEDDVVLSKNFNTKLKHILEYSKNLSPGYLIFLGGADTKVPKEFFSSKSPLFKLNIPTAEAYITDLKAIKLRLAWLETNKVSLPADHATIKMDLDCSISQYWSRIPLVTQGSVFGLFPSTLDKSRRSKGALLNRMIFEWKKFKRRTVPQYYYDIVNLLQKR